eukprot:gnl/MRDRNA2_/MRDRNA2_75035_c0_seq1.p1 gnl/MRDRNA2_/MRDRNA2_75035_c0~~gnl/MRDRNA2_/MRDRNA2_75035_c0_seq1.p1  ORF type:complete len:794 (+),score=156.32 gnl/MRDRNA2_/MRDRNA2_75035_c0_seq1:152-2533(+)
MSSDTKELIKGKLFGFADAHGMISKAELQAVLKKLGMAGADVDSAFKGLDLSKGSVSMNDFIDWTYGAKKSAEPAIPTGPAFAALQAKAAEVPAVAAPAPAPAPATSTKDLIKAKFKASDALGMVSKAELEDVLKGLGMGDKEFNTVFKNLDFSTGSISIDDFVDWTYGEKKSTAIVPAPAPAKTAEVSKMVPEKETPAEFPSLGVIRLDYDYPPAPGDIDHSGSFMYDVYYRAVPGLTFEVCQSGIIPYEVEQEFIEAIKWLCAKGVKGITGDCGFMMWLQALARKHTHKPVFMSSLAHLPAVTCAFAHFELIAIFTANSATLKPMKALIKDECGVDPDEKRYIIVGCENVPGFEAVALGQKVDTKKVTPGIVKLVKDTIKINPAIRAILMECTELPPYSDAVRAATGLPVFDAITCCDFFTRSFIDNPRFGVNDWQGEWDGEQDAYRLGQNLDLDDLSKMQVLKDDYEGKAMLHKDYEEDAKNAFWNAPAPKKPIVKPKAKPAGKKTVEPKKHSDGKEHPSLGVVRLDYNYPPAPGDIDCPASFGYDVYYRCVPGLTFETCQAGKMTPEVQAEFVEAIQYLEAKGVKCITGDCGFMMWFQALARQHTHKPVLMSSLAQLPAITAAFGPEEHIAILTANGEHLKPMRNLIRDECGVDPDEFRFVMVGLEDVPGFDAVARGEKVDVEAVTPFIVEKVQKMLKEHTNIRAILMECTELPPYSDAVRHATGLPVFDAITCCDLFLNGFMDNPLFGLNDWHAKWDGKQEAYKLGANLDKSDLAKLQHKTASDHHII